MENYLNKEYITAQRAAELAGVNYVTVLTAMKRGELTALDLGQGYKTTEEWVNAWMASRLVKPVAEQGEK